MAELKKFIVNVALISTVGISPFKRGDIVTEENFREKKRFKSLVVKGYLRPYDEPKAPVLEVVEPSEPEVGGKVQSPQGPVTVTSKSTPARPEPAKSDDPKKDSVPDSGEAKSDAASDVFENLRLGVKPSELTDEEKEAIVSTEFTMNEVRLSRSPYSHDKLLEMFVEWGGVVEDDQASTITKKELIEGTTKLILAWRSELAKELTEATA